MAANSGRDSRQRIGDSGNDAQLGRSLAGRRHCVAAMPVNGGISVNTVVRFAMINVVVLALFSVSALAKATTSPSASENHPVGVTAAEPHAVDFGSRIEAALIKADEVHRYCFQLSAGQFLSCTIQQTGIDAAASVFGPDGGKIADSDSRWHGPEPVLILADSPGVYCVEIRMLQRRQAEGRYVFEVGQLRLPTPEDQARLKAQALSTEAKRLVSLNDAESMRNALKKYEEAAPLWQSVGDQIGQAQVLNAMGYIHHRFADDDKALDFYQQALSIRQTAKDAVGEAECRVNMAAVYSARGQLPKAIALYQEILAIQRQAGDELGLTQTLPNLGIIFYKMGEYQQGLNYFEEAIPIMRALDNKPGLIQALIGLGTIYNRFGELQQSLDCFQQNLPLLKETNYLLGLAYNEQNLGAVYTELGDLSKAVEHLADALALMRRLGDRTGEAAALLNLGNAYLVLGDAHNALESYQKAREVLGDAGDRNIQALLLIYLGRAYLDADQLPAALDYFRQALERMRAIGDRRGEGLALVDYGAAQMAAGQDSAAGSLQQALTILQEVGDRSSEANALLQLALLERKAGKLGEARTHLESGIQLIEAIRSKLKSPDIRTAFFSSIHRYYEIYIDTLMQLHRQKPEAGYDAAALRASERARARSLVEMLTESGVDIHQGVAPELLTRELKLRRQLNLASSNLVRITGSTSQDDENRKKLKREIETGLGQYQEVQRQIREKSPAYAALTQPEPLSLQEIQEMLDEDSLLLEFKLGSSCGYLWAITKDRLQSFPLPAESQIGPLTRRVYEQLTQRNRRSAGETFAARQSRVAAADKQFQEEAASLSSVLLGPLSNQLKKKRLIIVPDAELQYIPFAALPSPQCVGAKPAGSASAPLGLSHEIVYLPSASVLKALRQEKSRSYTPGKILAVFADPVFDPTDGRLLKNKPAHGQLSPVLASKGPREAGSPLMRSAVETGLTETGLNLPRLPFSRVEAEEVCRVAPLAASIKALDFKACREAVLDPGLSEYRCIHLATHGILNNEHPELSGLVLSMVDEAGHDQDGFLRLHDIYNLRLPAELVTLSACQTALGKDIKGEGLVGLTRGFMYAGAKRVVASVWKVDDEATAYLMREFYQRLFGPNPLPSAQALQAAQQAVRRQKRWQAPYFWAAFILQGEWK